MAALVDQMKARIGRLEDVLAVHAVIAGYGLTIDGGLPDLGGLLWTEDSVYDSDSPGASGAYQSRADIVALIEAARNAELGFAHITHMPVVVVDGELANAYAASHLPVAPDGGDFVISRVSANKWDLKKTDGRWQIERRTSRVLDGTHEAKEIFAEAARRATSERTARASDGTGSNSEEHGMDITQELAAMDQRVHDLEDKFAILQVVAAYGPSMDGGAAQEAGSLWTEDSWYDTDSSPAASVPHGRAGIEGSAKRALEDPVGLAHISHMPLIRVDGDKAVVVNHSNTFEHSEDGFRIGRVSSNRWDLVRVDGVWQIERRVNRLLDGSKEARKVFTEGTREVLGE